MRIPSSRLEAVSILLDVANRREYEAQLARNKMNPKEAQKLLKEIGINPNGGIREDRIGHNTGIYNAFGDKLGWSDLSAQDFEAMRTRLPAGEPVFILSEKDSFWNFLRDHGGRTGYETKPEEKHPGSDYVIQHAIYLIYNGICYAIGRAADPDGFYMFDGYKFTPLDRSEVPDKIRACLN